MHEQILIGLASVIVIGIAAQWLAWRFRIPSILLLLIAGFLAGPVTGFLHPDELLGELLIPFVSLSVGIILFEGGLTLRMSELRTIQAPIRNLITMGALVTWVTAAAAAHWIVGLSWYMATLLGAILVVTGPTVIGPLLRHIGSVGPVGNVLKWEGILIDPIGATLALLVFRAILIGEIQAVTMQTVLGFARTVLWGGGFGLLGALIVIAMLRRHWIPESLDVPMTLTIVVAVITASDLLQSESGLLAATVMGMVLANQRYFAVKHIVEFKENLRVLLISALFILLAARLPLTDMLEAVRPTSLLFLAVLMLIVRPLAVFVSTARTELSWRERFFLSWMAPRGIVAAAVASIFALDLVEAGYPEAERLIPLTFLVIVGTVSIYGLTATPLVRWLGLSKGKPKGLVFLGAHSWARRLAQTLQEAGQDVLMVDTNRHNTRQAQLMGLSAYTGNILSDHALETMNLDDMGRLLAVTPNEEVNSLATLHFASLFGREEVYQLPPDSAQSKREGPVARPLRGRQLFSREASHAYLNERFAEGAVIKNTLLTDEFNFADLQAHYAGTVIPLFLITADDQLVIYTTRNNPTPQPGQRLVFLADPLDTVERDLAQQAFAEAEEAHSPFPVGALPSEE